MRPEPAASAGRKTVTRRCELCETPFVVASREIRRGRGRFCSHHCRLTALQRTRTLGERFWLRVDRSGPVPSHAPELGACWLWLGYQDHRGYGQISRGGRRGRLALTHRIAWELTFGAIPVGVLVLHHCDVPACVRPDHLRLGTAAENSADAMAKGRLAGVIGNPAVQPRGESHHSARLAEEDVLTIRRRFAAGESRTALAEAFGIKAGTIWDIVRRRSWRHLPP